MANKVNNILVEYKAELMPTPDGKVIVVSAKNIPPTERNLIQEEVRAPIVKWHVGVKASTIEYLIRELKDNNLGMDKVRIEERELDADNELAGHESRITIKDYEGADLDEKGAWEIICKYYAADGYYKTWSLGDRVYNPLVANELASHKPHDTINASDVLDVSILINSAKTVDEFLASI